MIKIKIHIFILHIELCNGLNKIFLNQAKVFYHNNVMVLRNKIIQFDFFGFCLSVCFCFVLFWLCFWFYLFLDFSWYLRWSSDGFVPLFRDHLINVSTVRCTLPNSMCWIIDHSNQHRNWRLCKLYWLKLEYKILKAMTVI